MHPSADGAAIGAGSLRDFRLLAGVVGGLDGGVYLNLGSAVVMPEVFVKALNLARNVGRPVRRAHDHRHGLHPALPSRRERRRTADRHRRHRHPARPATTRSCFRSLWSAVEEALR